MQEPKSHWLQLLSTPGTGRRVLFKRGNLFVKERTSGLGACAAANFPAHRTLAEFRQRHLKEISQLFVRLVEISREAGGLEVGNGGAVDGTKVKGNASKRKAIVEPVAGWIKELLGFRRFSFRGLWSGCRENGTWYAQPSI